jgi:phage antirepressor YoqD-like protein
MMKSSLKEWHQQHSQNMEGKITAAKPRISYFDSKAETDMLAEEEVKELQDLSVNLHSLSRVQSSINWQKSRLK